MQFLLIMLIIKFFNLSDSLGSSSLFISFLFVYLFDFWTMFFFRRAQPTVEFIFSATEEAVYVHVIVSAK